MRILAADDDESLIKLLAFHLKRWGHEVVQVRDGLAALQVLAGPDPPEMAILDWLMPGLHGPEVCRRLRAARSAPPYLMVLTGWSDPQSAAEALDAGADDHIGKPFDAGELEARIRAAERTIAQRRELARRVSALESTIAACPDCTARVEGHSHPST